MFTVISIVVLKSSKMFAVISIVVLKSLKIQKNLNKFRMKLTRNFFRKECSKSNWKEVHRQKTYEKADVPFFG